MTRLADFTTQPGERRDAICRLPADLLAEVNEGLRDGIGPTAVSRWLTTKGHRVSERAVRYHRDHTNAGSSENVTQGPEFVTRGVRR